MNNRLLTVALSMLFLSVGASSTWALHIDKVLLLTDVQEGGDEKFKDITSMIHDGQRFDFDLHDYFPEFFPSTGEARGFVFVDEDATFGQLQKGLFLKVTQAGISRNAQIQVFAHWDHAAGDLTQEIEVGGVLSASANGHAQGKYFSSMLPFISDEAHGGPVEANLGFNGPGAVVIGDGRGPITVAGFPAGRIDYIDLLTVAAALDEGAAAGDFAVADLLHTSNEISSVANPIPEPSSFLLVALGGGSLFLLRRCEARPSWS